MIIPIGFAKVNEVRASKFAQAENKGYEFINYVSPKAECHAESVGRNCIIFENNVIQPFVKIGDNCILWSGNHIGHHSTIDSHCFIASHAVISGSVYVGEKTFIGVNATIRDNVNIGKSNVIGAGATILSSTDDYAVYSPRGSDKLKVPSNRLRGI